MEGRAVTTLVLLFLLFASFLPAAFACQGFLDSLFLAGLQIKGVPLDLLNNVFLLHFALEPPQSVLEGLALLRPNFGQLAYTPKPVRNRPSSYGRGVKHKSRAI